MKKPETPEEKELNKKRFELAGLETELAQRELELATLQAELRSIEAIYLRTIGTRLAELDEIEAKIAEAMAKLKPDISRIQELLSRAHYQAKKSADETRTSLESKTTKFLPSENLKKLYREVAKLIHPDLAVDESERLRRQKLMADVNLAYGEGDEAKLRAILAEWESSPETVRGEGTAADLVRVIRKIAQINNRLRAIEVEFALLKESDLYKLKMKVEQAEDEGRDVLADLASQIDEEIALANKHFSAIATKRVNHER